MQITFTFDKDESYGWKCWKYRLPGFFFNTLLGIGFDVQRIVEICKKEKTNEQS